MNRNVLSQRRYRLRHPEYSSNYYKAHKDTEAYKEYHRRYREANRLRANERSAMYAKQPRGKWNLLKSSSRRRGITCTLSFEEFEAAIKDRECHYCGGLIGPNLGLDRKDSNLGYTIGNIVLCCWPCNAIKHTFLSYEEMLSIRPVLIRARNRRELTI